MFNDKIQFGFNLLKFSPFSGCYADGADVEAAAADDGAASAEETLNYSLSFDFVSLLNLCWCQVKKVYNFWTYTFFLAKVKSFFLIFYF